MRLRTGRSVGRTIYLQLGEEPSNADKLVGTMDTPELAAAVVGAVNLAGEKYLEAVVEQETVTMSMGAYDELRKAVLRGCGECGRMTGHSPACSLPDSAVGYAVGGAPFEPVRTSDCDCGVHLGQQHKPGCAFMRKLEANRQFVIRCEHGVDRSRVTCPPCGVQGPLPPAHLPWCRDLAHDPELTKCVRPLLGPHSGKDGGK